MAVRWKQARKGSKKCAARRCPKRLLFAKSRGRIDAGNPEGRHYRGKQSYGSQNDDHNGQGRGVVDADPVKTCTRRSDSQSRPAEWRGRRMRRSSARRGVESAEWKSNRASRNPRRSRFSARRALDLQNGTVLRGRGTPITMRADSSLHSSTGRDPSKALNRAWS
jgi:hypothetical protein